MFLFPSVMSFSAMRWASLALAYVVDMVSCSIREVTKLRSRACRWDDERERWRYLMEDMVVSRCRRRGLDGFRRLTGVANCKQNGDDSS